MFYMLVCMCVLELIVNHFNFSIILWATCKRSNSPTSRVPWHRALHRMCFN